MLINTLALYRPEHNLALPKTAPHAKGILYTGSTKGTLKRTPQMSASKEPAKTTDPAPESREDDPKAAIHPEPEARRERKREYTEEELRDLELKFGSAVF